MRIPARALKLCALALGVAALAGAALLLAPGRGSAAPDAGYLDFTGPGSGYLEVPDNPALDPTSAITVEAWIYLNSYEGWGTDPRYNADPQCPMLVGKNWHGAYALALGCGGDVMDSFINAHEHFTDGATIPLHTWTHIAMTWDGVTRKNFQDGVQIFSLAESDGPIGVTADPLRIGDDVQWDLSPNGRIDDVRIWNVARTQAEIAAGMNGVDPTTPGLVADWTFNDGSLTDLACNFTGTLVGDVQIVGVGVGTPLPTASPRAECGTATPTPTPTPTPTASPTPSPTPVPVGSQDDANCDGRFDTKDPAYLLARIAAVATPAPCPSNIFPLAPGDENCDHVVNVFDALAMLWHLSGVPTGWGCPSPCQSQTPGPSPTFTTATPAPTVCVTFTPSPSPTPTATPTPTPTPSPTLGPT